MHSVSSDTLVRLASGLDARCVKKQCGLVGLCFGGRICHVRRIEETSVIRIHSSFNEQSYTNKLNKLYKTNMML